MLKKLLLVTALVAGLVTISCRDRIVLVASAVLDPPTITVDPVFANDTLTMTWINPYRDTTGFDGFHVYLSINSGLVDLAGDDPVLDSARVTPSPIGRDADTVVAQFTQFADGTALSSVDSFYAHVRSVLNGTVGPGQNQFVVVTDTTTPPIGLDF